MRLDLKLTGHAKRMLRARSISLRNVQRCLKEGDLFFSCDHRCRLIHWLAEIKIGVVTDNSSGAIVTALHIHTRPANWVRCKIKDGKPVIVYEGNEL